MRLERENMNCIVCEKVITDDDEKELIGCDGDFIHKRCKKDWDKQCERINNMTDEEFEKMVACSN